MPSVRDKSNHKVNPYKDQNILPPSVAALRKRTKISPPRFLQNKLPKKPVSL